MGKKECNCNCKLEKKIDGRDITSNCLVTGKNWHEPKTLISASAGLMAVEATKSCSP